LTFATVKRFTAIITADPYPLGDLKLMLIDCSGLIQLTAEMIGAL